MINTTYEVKYYAEQAHTNARIASALNRQDVLKAIEQAPDCYGLAAFVRDDDVVISLNTTLDTSGEDISGVANSCNGSSYRIDQTVTVLDRRGVKVEVNISGRQPLTDDEKDLLRAIGKLQQRTEEILVC
jgi:hypothetical protein